MCINVESLLKRKIVLMGEENVCKIFYDFFLRPINIEVAIYMYCRTDFVDRGFWHAYSIKTELFSEKLISEKNYLVLLSVTDIFRRMEYDKLLCNSGLQYGENYVDALYVQHLYQKKYDISFDKDIWIFGAGNNGRYFYEKNKNTCSIKGFLSNYEEEKDFLGLPVIRPWELEKGDNNYIVICSEAYENMTEQLKTLGYDWFKDFCLPQLYPKKLFVTLGTCQCLFVGDILQRNMSFSSVYDELIFFENMDFGASFSDKIRMRQYGTIADVIYYQERSYGVNNQISYSFLINKYYNAAKQIKMPFYYFLGQFMQATEDVNPYTIFFYDDVNPWFRGDKVVNQMIESDYSNKDIIEKISSEDFWSEEEILDNYNQALRKIKILDRNSSIKLADFIEANYRDFPIFRDGTHFSIELGVYVANEICKMLDIELIKDIMQIKQEIRDEYKGCFPVYPSVAKVLKLKYGNSKDKFPCWIAKNEELEYLEFSEYQERYIQYVRSIKEIQEKYGAFFR